MSRVWVTNRNTSYDYTQAAKHGSLFFMTSGLILPREFDKTYETFKNYAQLAEPGDYLLLSGSNLVCGLAVAAWLQYHSSVELMQHGKMKDENGELIPSYLFYHVNQTRDAHLHSDEDSSSVL